MQGWVTGFPNDPKGAPVAFMSCCWACSLYLRSTVSQWHFCAGPPDDPKLLLWQLYFVCCSNEVAGHCRAGPQGPQTTLTYPCGSSTCLTLAGRHARWWRTPGSPPSFWH